jgi:hypothetical protein
VVRWRRRVSCSHGDAVSRCRLAQGVVRSDDDGDESTSTVVQSGTRTRPPCELLCHRRRHRRRRRHTPHTTHGTTPRSSALPIRACVRMLTLTNPGGACAAPLSPVVAVPDDGVATLCKSIVGVASLLDKVWAVQFLHGSSGLIKCLEVRTSCRNCVLLVVLADANRVAGLLTLMRTLRCLIMSVALTNCVRRRGSAVSRTTRSSSSTTGRSRRCWTSSLGRAALPGPPA